jgi:UDP-2-acetamido-3-amino-2,3-dideoxy-glucuronate N-acetyltransferase
LIHPSADVAAEATVGARSLIWDRVKIREGASVGDDCIIGTDVYIDAGVQVGDRVKIQNGALLYHGATVESGVFIGPGAILTNDRRPRSISPDGTLQDADDWTVTPILLEYGSSLGAGAIVVAGCNIGRFAMVGAGSVVTRSVPQHALVMGNPARLQGWVCRCGERLVGGGGATVAADHEGGATCPRDRARFSIHDGCCQPDIAP